MNMKLVKSNKVYRHLIAMGISMLLSNSLEAFPLALINLAGTLLVMVLLIGIVFSKRSERKKLKKLDKLVLN